MHNTMLPLVVASLIAAGAASAQSTPRRYNLTALMLAEPFTGDAWISDINNRGQVVGYIYTPDVSLARAFMYDGAMHEILPEFSVSIAGVNDRGQIIGRYGSTTVDTRAYVYDGSVTRELGTNPRDIFPFDINNLGMVVGEFNTGGTRHAFLHYGNTLRDLAMEPGWTCHGCPRGWSTAKAINNRGQVCGDADIPDRTLVPFLFNRVMQDLGGHGAANAINAVGQVVGWSYVRNGTLVDSPTLGDEFRAVLWNHRGPRILELPPEAFLALAVGINNRGQVVGNAGYPDGSTRPFLFDGKEAYDLNDLIARNSGWVLWLAAAISDSGRIVDRMRSSDNLREAGFLLTPCSGGQC